MSLVRVARRPRAAARGRYTLFLATPTTHPYPHAQSRTFFGLFSKNRSDDAEAELDAESEIERPNYLTELRKQDPRNRITFERPRGCDDLSFFGPTPLSVEKIASCLPDHQVVGDLIMPYLLPFWSVFLLTPIRLRTSIGGDRKSRRTKDTDARAFTGMSFPSVPPSHWAFGAVMLDGTQMLEAAYERDDESRLQIDDDDFGREVFQELDLKGVDGDLDRSRIPPFHYGPPTLTRAEQYQMAILYDFLKPNSAMKTAFMYGGDARLWYIPTYRMVYRVPLQTGQMAIIDPTFQKTAKWDTGYVLEKPSKPGTFTYTRHPYVSTDDALEPQGGQPLAPMSKLQFYTAIGDISEDGAAYVGSCNEHHTRTLEDTLLRAMVRNPITSSSWNNTAILKAHITSETRGATLSELFQHLLDIFTTSNADDTSRFVWLPNKDELAAKAKAAAARAAAARERAEAVKADRQEGSSTEASPPNTSPRSQAKAKASSKPEPKAKKTAEPKPQPAPQPKPADPFLQDHLRRLSKGAVNPRAAFEAKQDAAKLKGTISSLGKKVAERAARERAIATTYAKFDAPVEVSARGDLPRPDKKAFKDPKGYYKTLELHPGVDFLLYNMAASIDRQITTKHRALAVKYHPDKMHGDVQKMSAINLAKDHLEDCKKRVMYHNNGR